LALAGSRDSRKYLGFQLPKEEGKDGKSGNRAMSFGDDQPTRIFRNTVSYLIRYKIYAE
jgi:hypothetical protein